MTSRNQKINPTTEQAFGQGAALGIKPEKAREDHTHGTPVNPTDTHVAGADPHTQYQMEDVRLTALSGLNTTTGLVEQTGSFTFGKRPIGVATATDIPTRADGDARFAPIAKGVTNGDTHDHAGGDGAQIAHGALSDVGTNSHANIDTHLAAVVADAPHGIGTMAAKNIGVSGTFTTVDGKTVTVTEGVITAIV